MSRELSRPSAADDQALLEALGQAARGVADADGAAEPSPRAWHELVRDRATPGRRRWSNGWLLVAAGVVGLAAAFGIAGVVRRGILSSPLTFSVDGGVRGPGGDIQAEAGAGSDVLFSDGTEVQLASNARLRVAPPGPHGARMRLQAGEAQFQVVHRPHAAWFVEAGPYVIEVTGTAFDVRWSEAEQVAEVKMRSGSVRVSGPLLRERVTLGRGERLVARVTAGDVRIDDAHAASAAPVTAPVAAQVASPSSPAPVAAPPAIPLAIEVPGPAKSTSVHVRHVPARAPRVLAMQSPGAPTSQDPTSLPPPATPPAFEPVPPAGAGVSSAASAWTDRRWAARVVAGEGSVVLADAEALGLDSTLTRAAGSDLTALADAARYAGRGELAARALQELRRRFPGTAQAQAAAFLLGRAADDRGDTRAGLAWYRRYRAEAPAGPYASEALGREMLAIERLNGPAQARALAGEYLRRFPNGTYLLRARALLDSRP